MPEGKHFESKPEEEVDAAPRHFGPSPTAVDASEQDGKPETLDDTTQIELGTDSTEHDETHDELAAEADEGDGHEEPSSGGSHFGTTLEAIGDTAPLGSHFAQRTGAAPKASRHIAATPEQTPATEGDETDEDEDLGTAQDGRHFLPAPTAKHDKRLLPEPSARRSKHLLPEPKAKGSKHLLLEPAKTGSKHFSPEDAGFDDEEFDEEATGTLDCLDPEVDAPADETGSAAPSGRHFGAAAEPSAGKHFDPDREELPDERDEADLGDEVGEGDTTDAIDVAAVKAAQESDASTPAQDDNPYRQSVARLTQSLQKDMRSALRLLGAAAVLVALLCVLAAALGTCTAGQATSVGHDEAQANGSSSTTTGDTAREGSSSADTDAQAPSAADATPASEAGDHPATATDVSGTSTQNANPDPEVARSSISITGNNTIADSREVVCWGDSLTQGIGAGPALIIRNGEFFDASYLSYPEILAQFTGLQTFNFGVSGATSEEIVYMQGAITRSQMKTKPRTTNKTVMNQAKKHRGDVLIIEMGSNGGWNDDYDTLIEQYYKMIKYAGCDEYIIIGDTDDPGTSLADSKQQEYGTGSEDPATLWETVLAAEFGDHFVNMRAYLIEHGLEVTGLRATKDDREAIESGCVPIQLRYDWTHLNSYGYYAQAMAVYEKGKELGYWS